jgi:hypothetical protein
MRLSRALLRAVALVVLAGLLVGVPWLVFRAVGSPVPTGTQLSDAWRNRTVDAELVVRIGAAVFAVLWMWFAVTALAEAWHVLAWRMAGRRGALPVLPSGPSGWVRALVRFVAISSVTAGATFASLVPAVRAVAPSVPAASSSVWGTGSVSVELTAAHAGATHRAVGSETPYSLARQMGRPELRDRIIELNVGRRSPAGTEWQGGVFPAGMEIELPVEQVVPTLLGPAHEVVAGDSYWEIADDHLSVTSGGPASPRAVLDYTNELMSFNGPLLGHRDPALIRPGELVVLTGMSAAPAFPTPTVEVAEPEVVVPEVVVPEVVLNPLPPTPVAREVAVPVAEVPAVIASPPARNLTPADVDTPAAGLLPYATGLAAAMMLSAGAVGLLETRRRRLLRAATVGSRLVPPSLQQARTEVLLRSLDAGERLARLDLALRSAAPSLAAQSAGVQAVLIGDDGEITLFLRGVATPDRALWTIDLHANTWHLAAATSLSTLAEDARRCGPPCPSLVHIGAASGGQLFVDLESVGSLSVVSPHSLPILRHLAASLSLSPFMESAHLFTVGLGDFASSAANCEAFDTLDGALDAAAMAIGSTASLASGATTFALRTASSGGEAWEPAVVIAATSHSPAAGSLTYDAAAGGRGLAVVADVALGDGWSLRHDEGCHVLEPLGLAVQPVGLEVADIEAVAALLAEPFLEVAEPAAPVFALAPTASVVAPFVEQLWALRVGLFGRIAVTACDGTPADCERSKATELIVWLSQHRERSTRSAARTALWELDVRDATFANVVSDARRAMARAVAPPDGEEWIARTLTDELPLHERVVTDAALLAARVTHARQLAPLDAIEVLRPGVELLLGMPFAGTGYLWPDAEGVTSSLMLLATSAATELANHYLTLGDIDGVFWASGQGLKVLAGHEELIALRMRAHARRGDLAGVRGEWESYERAIAADPWDAAEPSAKLVALRRELLTPSCSPGAEGA